jgi:UDP-N-acetylmuramyl pentapeptide phosphotransferase/UDP-N-acetylglucosamine-1-phosphate transferase
MFYYLFKWLDKVKDVPGTGIFQFISVRAAMAAIFALLISMIFGKYVIKFLKKRQIGEIIRTDGPESHFSKQGTPTMGGVIIIAGIIIPVLFWAKLENSFIIMMLIATLFMGIIGFFR